jgi:hypothetical protein
MSQADGPGARAGRSRPGRAGCRRPAPTEGDLERAIAVQVRRLRLDTGLTVGEMALRVALDVPVSSLFRGADAKREAVFTAAGGGGRIVQRGTRVGHDHTLLGGLRGPHERMEARLVTLTERSEEFPLFQHPGTELLFVLEGEMVYGHGESSYRMRPGDALQLDGEGVHGP